MDIIALLLTLVVGLFIFVGSLLGVYFKDNNKLTDYSISIAFGVIISLIVLEILPEVYEILSEHLGLPKAIILIIVLSLLGIVILKILDLFVPHHTHEYHHNHKHNTEKCHNDHLYHIAIVSSIAIILHNIIEGTSLYLVSYNNITSGLLLCIGIGLHNIPMGLVVSRTLINSSIKKNKVLLISLLISISTFLGGLIISILGHINEVIEGVLLGVTMGMLLYIGIFELLHQIYHMKDKKIPKIGILVGVALIIISVALEHII